MLLAKNIKCSQVIRFLIGGCIVKIGVLMLGDIHFFDKDELIDQNISRNQFISDRVDMLSKMIEGMSDDFNDVIIVVNGDLTNKSQKKEYSSAYYYLQKIKRSFDKKAITSYFVFSQGNHDMTLSSNNEFDGDSSNNYYNFIDRFVDYCNVEKNKYYDIYRINTLGVAINFISMNPFSFCKSLDDFDNNKMYIDSKWIEDNIPLSKKEINIFLSHIPLDWYNRSNVNNYKFLDEQTFKIYSHEHHETEVKQDGNKMSIYLNCFSEETRKNVCGVVFGTLDTITTKFEFQSYDYTKDGFVAKNVYEKYLSESFGFDGSKYRMYRNSYEKFMNEDVSTLCGEDVQLLELFSEPRFYVIDDAEYENAKTQYKDLSELMNSDKYFRMILGGKKAGKTSILKYIFSKELMLGKCPIYIHFSKDNSIKGIKDKIKTFINGLYINNYSDIVSNKEVILLVDDFDLIQDPNQIEKIKDEIPFAEKVYIASSDDVSSFNFTDKLNDICAFKIQPFGYEARFNLINKWVQKKYYSCMESEKNKKNDEILRMINIISSDVLLSPDLVLIFLNAYSSNDTDKLISSSKIIYYKYLISKYMVELCNRISLSNLNYVDFFYKEISYYLLKHEESSLKEFNEYFLGKYSIDPEEYYLNLKFLKNNRFFDFDSEEKFKLSFFNAYFISEYYKTKINDSEIKKEFYEIIDHIAENDLYVNIVLFFLYNNTYDEYLNKCINNMNSLFGNIKLFDFNDDIKVFNSFIVDIDNKVKKEGNVIDNKIEMLRSIDTNIPKKGHVKKNELTMKLISSSNYLEISTEILPIIGEKEASIKLLKCMLELGLRRISDFVNLSRFVLMQQKNKEDFDNVFFTSLAIISSLLDDISNKIFISKNQIVFDVLSEYQMVSTECIKRKIEFLLLRKNDFNALKYIDSIVKYKDDLRVDKNYIAAAFLLINIDIELNYVGAYDRKNTSLLIEKSNKEILGSHSNNPIIEMNRTKERKQIRNKKF